MKSTKYTKLFFISMLTLILSGCSDDNDSNVKTRFEPIPFTANEQAALNSTEGFSLGLFKQYSELSDEPNVTISPLSATFAMAMVANGAEGETKSEILNALGFKGSGLEDMNSYAQRLTANLRKVDPSTEAIMANAMFYKSNISLEQSFADNLKSYYDADALSVAPDKYSGTVSDWISKKTNGALKGMNLGYDKAEFSIINAMNFRGFWEKPFEKSKTRKEDFYSYDGTVGTVEYICDERNVWIGQNDKMILGRLDFGNGAYSIEFIKPTDDSNIEENLETLDIEMLRSLRNDGSKMRVNIRIPKIDITLKSDLIPAMRSLGINKVFENGAQLNGIIATGSYFIGSVNQGCTFYLDEEGVVAQVVTVSNGANTAYPLEPGGDFFLDHPFVFTIRENSSGAILFMGKIGKL